MNAGYGIYFSGNTEGTLLAHDNLFGAQPIIYYHSEENITVENQTITATGNPTNLGKAVFINCRNVTIRNNTISNGQGMNGLTAKSGNNGGDGSDCSGIYVDNVTVDSVTKEIIRQRDFLR